MVYWGGDSTSMNGLWILTHTISNKFDRVIADDGLLVGTDGELCGREHNEFKGWHTR
jgi:hypothetical protein